MSIARIWPLQASLLEAAVVAVGYVVGSSGVSFAAAAFVLHAIY